MLRVFSRSHCWITIEYATANTRNNCSVEQLKRETAGSANTRHRRNGHDGRSARPRVGIVPVHELERPIVDFEKVLDQFDELGAEPPKLLCGQEVMGP